MNTINNPLIISYNKTYYQHHLSKNGDQSGEYIDKALAEEMLKALEKCYVEIRNLQTLAENEESALTITLKALISKVKGQ